MTVYVIGATTQSTSHATQCGEEYHCDDHHTTYPSLCDGCGDTKCREVADELWALIEDLVGSWSGEDTEITRLQKLLKYAKKLK